jgi:hypothetical protein
MRAALLALMLAACSGRRSGPPPPLHGDPREGGIDPLPGDGDRAYVADGAGLVELARTGASQVIARPPVSWCSVDAKSRVVWFTNETGLAAFDLDDRKLYPVILDDLTDLDVVIELGTQQLATHDDLDIDVKLVLAVADTPTLHAELGCEGDGYFRCYDDASKLRRSIVDLLARAKKVRLEDPAYVTSLAGRGAAGSLWSPTPTPVAAPSPPAVDRARCDEIPDRCGALTAIPASPLWLVETANGRGDYFHRTRELWDPSTAEFVRVKDGALVRTRTAPAYGNDDTDYSGLRASASGLSYRGVVFTPSRVIFTPQGEDGGVSCGWASGGWRIR